MINDQEIRLECLRLAHMADENELGETVLQRARTYLNFVLDKTENGLERLQEQIRAGTSSP